MGVQAGSDWRSQIQDRQDVILNHLALAEVIGGGLAIWLLFLTTEGMSLSELFVLMGPFLVVWVAVLLTWLFRRSLGYRLRVGILLLVTYLLGWYLLYKCGLVGSGRIWLVLSTALAVVFLGLRVGGAWASAVSVLTYVFFTVAVGLRILPQFTLDSNDPMQWVSEGGDFVIAVIGVSLVMWSLEQGWQEALKRLEQAAGDMRAILKSIADGVIVFNNDWRVTVVNAAAANLLDRSTEEIVGYDIGALMSQGDADLDADGWRAIHDMIETGDPTRFEWGGKMFSASLAPVREPSGGVVGSVAVLRDVTREAEVQRARDSLFAVTAHELRTPLNAIINFAKLMQDGLVPVELYQDTMARIIANGERLLIMANNLLESAQMAAGQAVLHVESFAPTDLICIVRDVVDVLAQRKGLTLTTHIEDTVPAIVTADRWRLHQVLVNLISNAIKFTDEGTVNVRVYVPEADLWALEISDTGCGVPPEIQERIFEPFVVADDPATRKQAGAGLGLFIVKQLVSLMGGEIELRSTLGQGSVFTVILPSVAAADGTGV
jgi:PAS domain S-box-containing protein